MNPQHIKITHICSTINKRLERSREIQRGFLSEKKGKVRFKEVRRRILSEREGKVMVMMMMGQKDDDNDSGWLCCSFLCHRSASARLAGHGEAADAGSLHCQTGRPEKVGTGCGGMQLIIIIIIIKRISRAPIYRTRWEHRALFNNTSNTLTRTHTRSCQMRG